MPTLDQWGCCKSRQVPNWGLVSDLRFRAPVQDQLDVRVYMFSETLINHLLTHVFCSSYQVSFFLWTCCVANRNVKSSYTKAAKPLTVILQWALFRSDSYCSIVPCVCFVVWVVDEVSACWNSFCNFTGPFSFPSSPVSSQVFLIQFKSTSRV